LKALSLDDALPEAHLALAETYFISEWSFAAAEREYKRYIELSDNDAQAWRSYADFLSIMRRFNEAEAALRRARLLEAFSYANDLEWAFLLLVSQRYEELVEHCQQTLKLHPQQLRIKRYLADGYVGLGQFEQAIRLQEELSKVNPSPSVTIQLAYYYAAAGRRNEVNKLLAQYDAERQASGTVSYRNLYARARLRALLGESEPAFALLAAAERERSVQLPTLAVDPAFDKLRADPRFTALLRRIGFAP
jgi:tetratricopeptide (TPR) repeat protein